MAPATWLVNHSLLIILFPIVPGESTFWSRMLSFTKKDGYRLTYEIVKRAGVCSICVRVCVCKNKKQMAWQ